MFGSVKLIKNADLGKYNYSSYGIGFNSRSEFLFKDRSFRETVIIFRVDVRSSVHINNKQKVILILGEGLTQELDDTKLTAEAIYPIHFTQQNKIFV